MLTFREVKFQSESEINKNIDFPAHLHDDIELIYCEKGRSGVYCDGKSYLLTPGCAALVFPNQIHSYENSQSGVYYKFIIPKKNLLLNKELLLNEYPKSSVNVIEDKENFVQLLRLALKAEKDEQSLYQTLILTKVIKSMGFVHKVASEHMISEILSYCASHYKEKITVKNVSEALYISKSYISHIFGSRLHINFCKYINSLRLTEAITLMENKKLKLSEIAERSGFQTIRTMSRVFKENYGISPGEYREKIRAKGN